MKSFLSLLYLSVALTLFEPTPVDVADTPVRLGTNVVSSGRAEGKVLAGKAPGNGSLAHVDCVFRHLTQRYSVRSLPWHRARREVFSGKLDGFFTAMPQEGVHAGTQLSSPLVLESWYWFWRAGSEPPSLELPDTRIGVILGSHQEEWLNELDYPPALQVNHQSQLLKLTLSGRIDAFIADREQFEQAALALGVPQERYDHRFLRYVPLGARFSRNFLDARPGFLSRFNRFVYACAPEGFRLSPSERERVGQLLGPMLSAWLDSPLIERVLSAQNDRHRTLPMAEIQSRDNRWQAAFQQRDSDRVKDLVDRRLSVYLAAGMTQTGGVVTQIIVTDGLGLNAGISTMTSDYWQGDEDKFLRVYGEKTGQLVFGPVLYDESSRRFQVHVGLPLYHSETEQPLGVITLGVDVELALSREG